MWQPGLEAAYICSQEVSWPKMLLVALPPSISLSCGSLWLACELLIRQPKCLGIVTLTLRVYLYYKHTINQCKRLGSTSSSRHQQTQTASQRCLFQQHLEDLKFAGLVFWIRHQRKTLPSSLVKKDLVRHLYWLIDSPIAQILMLGFLFAQLKRKTCVHLHFLQASEMDSSQPSWQKKINFWILQHHFLSLPFYQSCLLFHLYAFWNTNVTPFIAILLFLPCYVTT